MIHFFNIFFYRKVNNISTREFPPPCIKNTLKEELEEKLEEKLEENIAILHPLLVIKNHLEATFKYCSPLIS